MRSFLMLIFVTLPFTVEAQSFNCRFARTPDEVKICQVPELRQRDKDLAEVYFMHINESIYMPRRAAAIRAQQARFLRARRACGAYTSCLTDLYQKRLNELDD